MANKKDTSVSILLIDDDASLLETAQTILKDMDDNLTIDIALNVDEAKTKLASKPYDVIVSDYEMPQKNGLDLLKDIREKNNKTPFILFTGKGREEIAIQALNLGADRYINKHGSPETVYKELTVSIHQLHEKSRAKSMLMESEQRLRLFIENIPEAIFVSDTKGRLLDQNRQSELLNGYRKEELFGKDLFEMGIIAPEAFPVAAQHLQAIEAGTKVGPTEFILKRKDGTKVTVEVSIFPIKYGEEIELLGVARDVTERKNAEHELEQKYEALERVAQSLDSGLAIIGRDYRVIWANSVLQQKGPFGAKHCYEVFSNLKHVCPDCGVKKIFEHRATLDVHEYESTDRQGKHMWVELRVTPLKDKDGNIIAALELAVPITQRKKAEAALIESQERYAKLASATFEGILVTNYGKILDANDQFARMHKYELSEIIGKDVSMLIPPEYVNSVKEKIGKSYDYPYESYGLKKDGTIFPVEVQGKTVTYKGQLTRISTIVDMTERKKNEQQLRVFSTLFELASDAIFVCDLEGRIVYFNQATHKQAGYSREEMEKITLYEFCTPEQAKLIKSRIKAILENQNAIFESTHLRKDKTAFPVEVSSCVIDTNGTKLLLNVARDISERKKAEEAVRESEERYAKLAAASFEGILISRDGKVLDANPQFLEIHRYQLEEIIGKDAPDILVAPQSRELVRKSMLSGFEGPYEFTGLRKDGSTFSEEARAKSITYKGAPARVSAVRDITERKKNEAQLLIFSSLFELASDAIYVCDLDGRILYFNEATHKTAGYSRDEMSKMTLFDFCPPWQADHIKPRIKRVVENQSAVFESEHMRKDGSIIPCEVSGRVIDANGTKLLLNVARDISERRKAEQALRGSQERYRMIADNMTDVITVTDADGYFVYVSPSAQSAYGYTPEELIGKNAFDLTHPDDMVNGITPVRKILVSEGSSPHIQFRFRKKDGSYVWIESNAKAFTNADGDHLILAVARTIEDRKKVERELKLASDMFDVATDAIYVHDLDGRLLHSNEAAYKLWWGYTKEELSKTKLSELDISGPPQFVDLKISEIMQKGSAVFETFFLDKDKVKRPVEVHAKLVDVEGKKILSVARDISERKKAEARLAAVNEKLRVVGSLTRHDVRNKLTTINSTTYLLKKKYSNDPELTKYLSNIDSAVAMANRIFDFSAFYEKIGAQNPSEIDIAKCFDAAMALFPNLSNVAVLNETAGLVVVADSLLQQVFYNLIDNSLKHGQKVTQIRLYYRTEGDQIKLIYEDNGVGVSGDNKPRIFHERFTTGNGTGLGLSTIKQMMAVYNWSIHETGVPTKGARFEITIPQQSRIS